MLSLGTSPSSHLDDQTCYFDCDLLSTAHRFPLGTDDHLLPSVNLDDTVSAPTNPLVAYNHCRPPPHLFSTQTPPSSLQMDTAVAHGQTISRPQPHPLQQNVLHVTSDDIHDAVRPASHDSSSSDSHSSSLDLARCSRCQRTPSTDYKTGKSNMIRYGLNLWYCNRCANMVGLNR